MKITKELLIEKGARCEGLQQFARFFPSGFDGEWTRELQIKILTKTRLRRHFGWAVDAGVVPMWGMNGANLVGASLYRANLDGAWYTKETIFPKDFDSKAAGMVLEE